MLVGKVLLWWTQRVHLLRCRLQLRGKEPLGLIIIGYGRSGSTLLTRMIASNSVADLGEPLRTRKQVKSPLFFSNNTRSQILSEYYLMKTRKDSFVAHVKPYHTSYWGENWEDFVKSNSKRGWVFIGLRRNFVDRWYSEMRARGRGSWTGDEGKKLLHWSQFLDRTQFEEEAKRDLDFERKLKIMERKGWLSCIVDYEANLSTKEVQLELCSILGRHDVSADLEGINEKHAAKPEIDAKNEDYQWMVEKFKEIENR